jgi:hypothetical protein
MRDRMENCVRGIHFDQPIKTNKNVSVDYKTRSTDQDSASTSDFYGQSDCFQHTNGKKECILWKSVHPGEFRTKTTSVNCTRDNPPIVDNPGFFVDVELHCADPSMRTPNFYFIFSTKSKLFQQNPKNKPSFYRFRSSHNFILLTV